MPNSSLVRFSKELRYATVLVFTGCRTNKWPTIFEDFADSDARGLTRPLASRSAKRK
jgi:hypothetical protein